MIGMIIAVLTFFALTWFFMIRCIYLDRTLLTTQSMLKNYGIELTWGRNSVTVMRKHDLFPDWHYVGSGDSYWRDDPRANGLRWHVSKEKENTFGSVQGQILQDDGWYWWTADLKGNKFSSMSGPYTSPESAMADCETAHRPAKACAL